MNQQSIPSYRAAHLQPYIKLLNEIGAPVERYLQYSRLPVFSSELTEQPLSLLKTLTFLSHISDHEGIDDLALRAKENTKIEVISPLLLQRVNSAPTLKIALESVIQLAKLEDSQLNIWMTSTESSTRVYNSYNIPFEAEGVRHMELDTSTMLINIIRTFAGAKWWPDAMGFQSRLPLGRYATEKFKDIRCHLGEKDAWIEFPRKLLSLAPRLSTAAFTTADDTDTTDILDFSSSLKSLLSSYLTDYYPDIQLAAEIAGLSIRTLQRRLKAAGINYSELIQQLRFEKACRLLNEPDNKLIDIAYTVGYEDPSHFSRAFRRIAGVSPKHYRSQ